MKGTGGLVSWFVATGFLWMILSRIQLTVSCPDEPGIDIPCPLNKLPGVRCTYMKGTPAQIPEPDAAIDYPGPVKNVNADSVVNYDDRNSCGTYLNITWFIDPLANQRFLSGFLLNVTFFYEGKHLSIVRTYNLSVSNWSNMDIYKTAFRHECIIPATGTAYQIRIHSLPLSSLNEEYFVDYFLRTSDEFSASVPCERPNNSSMTYNWRAMMWAKQNPSKDTNSDLEICFFLAPVEYGFQTYKVSLLNSTTLPTLPSVAEIFVYEKNSQDRKVCVTFSNICPGTYKAWVMPVNEPRGVCRAGPNPDDVRDSCYATELSPIDLSKSVCSSSKTTTSNSLSSSFLGSDDAKIAGICVGIIVALVLFAVLIVVYIRYRNQIIRKRYRPPLPDFQKELSVGQQTVLLIYSTDNESHRKVIRSFAAFLHACCGCEVLYDEWSQVAIAQTNPIDWLSKQMYRVKHVIIVNSLGAYEQYRGWIEQKLYVPESNLLLPDMFIPAIRQLQNKFYQGSPKFHCFHVCFPYTDQKHILDLSCGRCYKLMDHIEDLVLNIHGLSKISAKGTSCVEQVKSTTYHLNAVEGMALRDAIHEAIKYARMHPNWFHKYYKLDGTGSSGENKAIEPDGSSICDMRLQNDHFLRPSSIDSGGSKDGSRTSDLDNHSDSDFVSPSSDGSCSGDNTDINGSSPDFGIGGMDFDGMIEASPPPMFNRFAPLPPDDLDDTSSIGSRLFMAKVNEFNNQFDSGFSSSSHDFRASHSNC